MSTFQGNPQVTSGPPFAETWPDAPASFFAATTHAAFDGALRSPLEETAEKLRSADPRLQSVSFAFARQVHGGTIAVVSPHPQQKVQLFPDCDGLLTDAPKTMLVIRTADCLPVVVVDQARRRSACLHAGWRGTFENITGAAIETMLARGSRREDLRVWVGPGISAPQYEVSEELIKKFQARFADLGTFSRDRFLDLPRLNRLQAVAAGLPDSAVALSGRCTYSETETFYSHRRQGKARGHLYTVCGFTE